MSSLPKCLQNKNLKSICLREKAFVVERVGELYVLHRGGQNLATAYKLKRGKFMWAVHPTNRNYRESTDHYPTRKMGYYAALHEIGYWIEEQP